MDEILERNIALSYRIIRGFSPRSLESQEYSLESPASDEAEEGIAEALLNELNKSNQNALLHGPSLDRLYETGNLSSYLCALMTALQVVVSPFVDAPL